jgi:hypothetical protein
MIHIIYDIHYILLVRAVIKCLVALYYIYIDMISQQLTWLKNNRPDFQTAVISRNGDNNKMLSMLANILAGSALEFKIYKSKIWTCKGSPDDCLQTVLYHGNEEPLNLWTF